MRNKRVLSTILAFLVGAVAFAQTPYASITYAEGMSFILVRDGKTATWSIASDDVFGMEIKPGDIIQTSASSFLELAINPISATVQIAENTSFRFDADESGTKSTGELYYGRVRAKVAKLAGSSSYRISSPSLVAGVRGTDFGCDVISTAGAPIVNRVFCFEGSVLVAEAVGTKLNTILIAKDEMVEKVVTTGNETNPENVAPLEKKSLSGEVINFWNARPFSDSVTTVPPATTVPVRSADEEKSMRNKRIPNITAISLIALGSLTCIGAAIYSNQVSGDSPMIAPAQSAGIVMISSGIVLAVISSIAH